MWAAAARLQHPLACLPSGHAKVGHLDVLVPVQQEVLGLQVAVADVEAVAVVYTSNDLLKVPAGLVWVQSALRDEIVKELAAFDIF